MTKTKTYKKWSKEEDKKLLDIYGKWSLKDIIMEFPDRTLQSILNRASKTFHLKSITKIKWNDQLIQKLRLLYPCGNKEELTKTFKSKWHTIKLIASRNGIHRSPKYHIERLLDDNFESYYWIGFLMADGCFYKKVADGQYDRNEISLELSIEDISHLEKFINYIGYKNTINHRTRNKKFETVEISMSHPDIIPKITKKFDIKSNKTYNPPSNKIFLAMPSDKYFSLIVGYIDGDGSIYKRKNGGKCILRIENHKYWSEFDINLEEFLFNTFSEKHKKNSIKYRRRENSGSAENGGTAYITITKSNLLRKMKEKAKELHLPYLERKWDKIQ